MAHARRVRGTVQPGAPHQRIGHQILSANLVGESWEERAERRSRGGEQLTFDRRAAAYRDRTHSSGRDRRRERAPASSFVEPPAVILIIKSAIAPVDRQKQAIRTRSRVCTLRVLLAARGAGARRRLRSLDRDLLCLPSAHVDLLVELRPIDQGDIKCRSSGRELEFEARRGLPENRALPCGLDEWK